LVGGSPARVLRQGPDEELLGHGRHEREQRSRRSRRVASSKPAASHAFRRPPSSSSCTAWARSYRARAEVESQQPCAVKNHLPSRLPIAMCANGRQVTTTQNKRRC